MLDLAPNDRRQLTEFAKAFRSSLRSSPSLKPSEWAEKHRRMSPEASAKTFGKWKNLPFQVEPLNAVIEQDVRHIVLIWAAQTGGKTEIINNALGYFCEQEPSPSLVVQPDLVMAESWSNDRLKPMVRDTPVLANIFGDRQRILAKKGPGFRINIGGANSPSGLAGRPVRIVLFDEVDRYPDSAGKEGDPIKLGEARQESFTNAVTIKTSTPTVKGHSRIEADFELSDKRYWFCKCPACGVAQTLRWSQVRWPTGQPEEAYYLCENEACGYHWTDEERITAVENGYWYATAPFNGIRGYHLNGIYVLFKPHRGFKNRLHEMAVRFLEANKLGKQGLKVWTNTFLAETWADEHVEKPKPTGLYSRREAYSLSSVPRSIKVVTAGVDVQQDRIEAELVGWGTGEETWGLGNFAIYGDPRIPRPWVELDAILARNIPREDGVILKISAAGIDTGYEGAQRATYDFIRPRTVRNIYAVKGASSEDAEPISFSAPIAIRERLKLILVGTNRIKSVIYSNSTIEAPGHGYMHFPMEYEPEWFAQLLMEDFVPKHKTGKTINVFSKPKVVPEGGTDRNEALDKRVYAYAALKARFGVINWDYEEKKNLTTIGQTGQEKPRGTGRVFKRRQTSGGLLGGIFG